MALSVNVEDALILAPMQEAVVGVKVAALRL